MTDKAKKILRKMKLTKLFRDPKVRDRILDEFNRDNMDDVGPLRGDQGRKVLQEMNQLGERQEKIIRDGVPTINLL
jgi:transcription antitermination factor NusA-like protein